MDEFDFDERLNELPNNYEEKEEKVSDIHLSNDYGKSINAEANKKSLGIKTWRELRSDMAEGYRTGGVFKGTLKAIGIIALSVISMSVTLTKYLLTHEAEPFDYEKALSQRADKKDMMNHYKDAKKEEKSEEKKMHQENNKVKSNEIKKNNNRYIPDSDKVKEAINELRGTQKIKNKNNHEIEVKTIAGMQYIGYSAKTGNLMFYSKDRKTKEVHIDTGLLKTVGVTNQISDIINKKALQQYKESVSSGLFAEPPVDKAIAEKIKITSAVKAVMLVGAINHELNKDNMENKLSSVVINGHKIELQRDIITENNPTGEANKNSYDCKINVLLDGEIKESVNVAQITNINSEAIDEMNVVSILYNSEQQAHNSQNEESQSQYASVPPSNMEYDEEEYESQKQQNDCKELEDLFIDNPDLEIDALKEELSSQNMNNDIEESSSRTDLNTEIDPGYDNDDYDIEIER